MAGPTLRTYKAGSIIYFIEDKGSDVFVLQKGRIILISNSLDSASEIKEDVQKGEFFGVKSALGAYPREETAQVLADSVVLVFTPVMFEAFCTKNPRLVLQMLKVFSGQLRKVHRKVREVLGETGQQENSVELLRTAESFYKMNLKDHANYAFKTFLKNYSTSNFATRGQSMLDMISRGQPYPVEMDSLETIIEKIRLGEMDVSQNAESTNFGDMQMNDVGSMEPPPLDDFSQPEDMHIPDMDDTGLSNDDGSGMMDIPDMDLPDMDIPDMDLPDYTPSMKKPPQMNVPQPSASKPALEGITQFYYDGVNEFSKQNWDVAIKRFEAALSINKFENDAEASFLEKSLFELGRTYMRKGDLTNGIGKLSDFVKKYPRNPNLKKAMAYIAEGYEKKGDKQRAMALYNKVVSMPPRDKESNYAKTQLDRLMK
ncbi:MAG: cyclic nucleotide-binding domain-containing protein [Spirochaetia bacterium]|nr:cyclic nucleotide-binding domain-containing protein [Spirochaetia bacterium]